MPPSADIDPENSDLYVIPAAPTKAQNGRNPLISIQLPRTVAEVRETSKEHTLFAHRKLDDAFAFDEWCVFLPHAETKHPREGDTGSEASAYLFSQRHVLGGNFPDSALFVTLVNKDGDPDVGLASELAKVAGFSQDDLPLLILTREPSLRIFEQYEDLADASEFEQREKHVEGVVISLKGVSGARLKPVLTAIREYLADGNLQLQQLQERIAKAQSKTKLDSRKKTALKYGGPVVAVIGLVAKFLFGT